MFDTPVVHAPGKQSDATNQDALILNWEGCRCAMNAHQTCDWVAFGDSKTCTDKRRPPTMYDFGFNAEGFVTGGMVQCALLTKRAGECSSDRRLPRVTFTEHVKPRMHQSRTGSSSPFSAAAPTTFPTT